MTLKPDVRTYWYDAGEAYDIISIEICEKPEEGCGPYTLRFNRMDDLDEDELSKLIQWIQHVVESDKANRA